MITLVVDFHSSTTYLQSQKFLALVTTLKYLFQSVRKILSGPCMMIWNISITSGYRPFSPGDFSTQSIEITLLILFRSWYLHICYWADLFSIFSTACCSTIDSALSNVPKYSFHLAKSSWFSGIIVLLSRGSICFWWFILGPYIGYLRWCNSWLAKLANLQEWVRVSVGASFMNSCATSKQTAK